MAIVRAMISMAKALGMTVIAEGVETPHQAQVLAKLGCDSLQGFLFSAAVPAQKFEAMLQAGRVEPRRPTAFSLSGEARAGVLDAAGNPILRAG